MAGLSPCATAAQLCSLARSHGGHMHALLALTQVGAALVPGCCRGRLPACSLVPDCHQPIRLPCRQSFWQRPPALSTWPLPCRPSAHNVVYIRLQSHCST